eukprot:Hpha_TRINITY_DN36173_c0_g1::TRINITY_DN36173_c0_g1_i1::g.36169::m.36169
MPLDITGLLRNFFQPLVRGLVSQLIDDSHPHDPNRRLNLFGDLLSVQVGLGSVRISSLPDHPLRLKRTAFTGLNLPLEIVGGAISGVDVRLSVSALRSPEQWRENPVVVKDIRVLARPTQRGLHALWVRFTPTRVRAQEPGSVSSRVAALRILGVSGELLADIVEPAGQPPRPGGRVIPLSKLAVVSGYQLWDCGGAEDPIEWELQCALTASGPWEPLHRRVFNDEAVGTGCWRTFGVRVGARG